jgi:hypothetical protein
MHITQRNAPSVAWPIKFIILDLSVLGLILQGSTLQQLSPDTRSENNTIVAGLDAIDASSVRIRLPHSYDEVQIGRNLFFFIPESLSKAIGVQAPSLI